MTDPLSGHRAFRALPVVLQTEIAECGLACLCMVGQTYGSDISLSQLRRKFGGTMRGMSMARLVEIAEELQFDTRVLRAEPRSLRGARVPCVLHWNLNHYVVLKRATRKGLEIHDPARGHRIVGFDEVDDSFTGLVIELKPRADFRVEPKAPRLPTFSLLGRLIGLKTAFAQIAGLALCIELLGLALPYQVQWIVDAIVPSEDLSLLVVAAVAFASLALVQMALVIANSRLITWLGTTLNVEWSSNLFSHLLRLPLDYFEKRQMGDVISRFGAIKVVQSTVTGGFIEAIFSGVVSSLAIIVLWLYSAASACLAISFLGLYVIARWAIYRRLWSLNEQQIVYSARQQSELIESIRGVQAVKLAGKEGVRLSRFAHITSQSLDRDMQVQRVSMSFTAATQALFGLQRIALLSVGAYFAIRSHMTAGMLVAMIAYADQFMSKSTTLVDRLTSFRMLRLQFDRISDIALEEPETVRVSTVATIDPLRDPLIHVKNLSFRYSESDPWVFQNLSFSVDRGEALAVVGPSGCGKTTLAKVLLGLLEPTTGVVIVGGVDIHHADVKGYRRMVAAVMQDDHLFAGSVAENIAFFDEHATDEAIRDAAQRAGIHEEIACMPMGYETLVGDMGSTLSGGQKQRVLLARALYRNPQILVLDEATSHLDVGRERQINRNLASAACTKIVIAHRQDTIDLCDRVLDLNDTGRSLRLASIAESALV